MSLSSRSSCRRRLRVAGSQHADGADLAGPVGDRDLDPVAGATAPGASAGSTRRDRLDAVRQVEPDLRLQGGGGETCCLRDGRQQLVRGRALAGATAELGQRVVRLGPGAVRQAVGQPDDPAPQRLEGQRDDRRDDQREAEALRLAVEAIADGHHHDDVRRR